MTATLPLDRTPTLPRSGDAAELRQAWAGDRRWSGISRSYSADDVVRLRGTVEPEAEP